MTESSPTYFSYGKHSLEQRFLDLLHQIDVVIEKKDEDGIHDVRVASRRFHAAAQMFPDCLPATTLDECEGYVKKIRKSAGDVRDEDVERSFVDLVLGSTGEKKYHAGMKRILVRLWQRREKKVKLVISAIDEFRKHSIAEQMKSALSAPVTQTLQQDILYTKAERKIGLYLDNLLSFQRFVTLPDAVTELHNMRIAAKRLRYIMEIFDPAFDTALTPFITVARSLQDALGEMHDCDIWLQTLPVFLEKERGRTKKFYGDATTFSRIEKGILYLIHHVRSQRLNHYRKFLKTWKKCEKNETWKMLLEGVKKK